MTHAHVVYFDESKGIISSLGTYVARVEGTAFSEQRVSLFKYSDGEFFLFYDYFNRENKVFYKTGKHLSKP